MFTMFGVKENVRKQKPDQSDVKKNCRAQKNNGHKRAQEKRRRAAAGGKR